MKGRARQTQRERERVKEAEWKRQRKDNCTFVDREVWLKWHKTKFKYRIESYFSVLFSLKLESRKGSFSFAQSGPHLPLITRKKKIECSSDFNPVHTFILFCHSFKCCLCLCDCVHCNNATFSLLHYYQLTCKRRERMNKGGMKEQTRIKVRSNCTKGTRNEKKSERKGEKVKGKGWNGLLVKERKEQIDKSNSKRGRSKKNSENKIKGKIWQSVFRSNLIG